MYQHRARTRKSALTQLHRNARRIPFYVESISSSSVRVYTVPTDAPEADGTISWNSTTMVLVELVVGDVRGIGYTYADAATAKVAQHLLKTIIDSADPFQHPALWMQMQRSVRNLGNRGIAAMAISAIDVALWDLRARLLHVHWFNFSAPRANRLPRTAVEDSPPTMIANCSRNSAGGQKKVFRSSR